VPFSSSDGKNSSALDFWGYKPQWEILSGSGDGGLVRIEWDFPEIYTDLCLLPFSDFHQGCEYL